MSAYYNENDPKTAAWLRELIKAGLIVDGEVDERSITDVTAGDLRGFVQCHFFAGIGGWSYALRLAGWPDNRQVWTGSSPCLPHSSAARGRHVAADLWPPFFILIVAGQPDVVFGEQVAGARPWLDGVGHDLETLGYAFGAAVIPACSVGLDHARQRIFFVGHANRDRESRMSVDVEMDRLSRHRRVAGSVVPPDGIPDRVATLRGFGNAIVPQVAQVFIEAYLDVEATRLSD